MSMVSTVRTQNHVPAEPHYVILNRNNGEYQHTFDFNEWKKEIKILFLHKSAEECNKYLFFKVARKANISISKKVDVT